MTIPIPAKRGFISHLKTLKRIAHDHVKVSLNSERTWKAWLETLPNQSEHAKRFVRLNVSCVKDPPSLDDVKSMPQLRTYVQEQYSLNRLIEDIAHRLVASSFYVVPAQSLSGKCNERYPRDKKLTTAGSEELRCRLARGEIQALGQWLSRLGTPPHKPYFIIRQSRDSASPRRIWFPEELLRTMTRSGEFALPFIAAVNSQTMVEILLCLKGRMPRQEHMISGFPKVIDQGRGAGKCSHKLLTRKTFTECIARETKAISSESGWATYEPDCQTKQESYLAYRSLHSIHQARRLGSFE